MVQAHTLKPGVRKKKVRVGRGNASGKGTFSGRGCKGQKARTGKKLRPGFEGGQTPLVQRMPKLRGFTSRNKVEYQVINIKDLDVFKEGTTVDKLALLKAKRIQSNKGPIKLLSDGTIDKKLTLQVDAVSKLAQEKIEKAGGSVNVIKK